MTMLPADGWPRFHAPDLDPSDTETRLPADEARHLTRVLRLGRGATVAVFDGRGHEFLARVTEARHDMVTMTLLEPVVPAAESIVPFTLAPAVLKGTAMDDVVRDATMMGAVAIQPLLTRHTVVKPELVSRRGSVERWRRIAVASAKQSRRATVPDVPEPVSVERAIAQHAGELTLMFVEPAAGRDAQPMRALLNSAPPHRATLIVGPEGGWAAAEMDAAAAAGATLVTLGKLTLRADAVPIAALAMFRMLWEDAAEG